MAFGFYDHGLVALCERLTDHLPLPQRSGPRQRLWKVRCRRAILATGAFERPIACSGNDIPGVLLARSAERRVGTECVSPCRSRWSRSHSKKQHNYELRIIQMLIRE